VVRNDAMMACLGLTVTGEDLGAIALALSHSCGQYVVAKQRRDGRLTYERWLNAQVVQLDAMSARKTTNVI
jgi:hypothetical protein